MKSIKKRFISLLKIVVVITLCFSFIQISGLTAIAEESKSNNIEEIHNEETIENNENQDEKNESEENNEEENNEIQKDDQQLETSTKQFRTFNSLNKISVITSAPETISSQYYVALVEYKQEWNGYASYSKVTKLNLNGETLIEPTSELSSQMELVVLELRQGRSFTENFDTNAFKVYKNQDYLSYSYRLRIEKLSNQWNITISNVGTNATSLESIKNKLGIVNQYAVMADRFTIDGHIEGNIAVNNMTNGGEIQNTQNVTQKITKLTINVEKTVTPQLSQQETFRFGLFENNTCIETKTITIPLHESKSVTQFVVEKSNGFSNNTVYAVYELDNQGNPLKDGDCFGNYTVSYTTSSPSDHYDSIMGSSNVSYVKSVDNNQSLKALYHTISLVTTEEDAKDWYGFLNVDVVSETEFNKMMNIQNHLNRISELSKDLAHAKTENDVHVYNIPISDLTGQEVSLPDYQDADNIQDCEVAVLNIIIPKNETEVTINPHQLYLLTKSGRKYEIYNGGSWNDLATKIIWNYVDEDGNPYQGIVHNSSQMIGTMIIPEGTLYVGGSAANAIVGKTIIQTNEIHKVPFAQTGEREVNVICSNVSSRPHVDVSMTATKTLQNGTLSGNDFSFHMYQSNESGEKGQLMSTAQNNALGIIDFGKLTYYEEGTYYYLIEEEIPEGVNGLNQYEGIQYDASKYLVTVNITMNNDQLISSVIYKNMLSNNIVDSMNFANQTYIDSITISGKKTWDDHGNQDGKRPQSITVYLKIGDNVVDSASVTAKEDWSWSFQNLPKYANGKEIKYSIAEEEVKDYLSSVDGYNITNTHTIEKVDISGNKIWKDNDNIANTRPDSITVYLLANGVRIDSQVVTKENQWKYSFKNLNKYDQGREIQYTVEEKPVSMYESSNVENSYDIVNTLKSTSVQLMAKKVMTGRDLNVNDKFNFVVLENEQEVAKGQNDKEGNILFSAMTYHEVGEHDYVIKEVAGTDGEAGIYYSKQEYQVKVAVFEKDGQLCTSVTYPDHDIVIENIYKSKATSVTLEAQKVLTGATLKANQFAFELIDSQGKVISTAKNDAQGKIVFSKINYDKPGQYLYSMKEINGGKTLNRIVYDDSVHKVTVNVKDNGKGQLVANISYPNKSITFYNSYITEQKTKLILYKIDQEKNFLEGANFQMYRQDGKLFNAIKDRARFEFNDLTDGEYTVVETTTPEGYEGIGEFHIVIENGLITCPEYGITDPFVTLSIENTDDGAEPDVFGDEYDDEDFDPDVYGDETDDMDSDLKGVETSDNDSLLGYMGLFIISLLGYIILRKKKSVV